MLIGYVHNTLKEIKKMIYEISNFTHMFIYRTYM